MSTKVDIPEEILERAMRTHPARSPQEVVVNALEEYTQRHSQKHLIQYLGTFDDFMTPEELAEMRSKD